MQPLSTLHGQQSGHNASQPKLTMIHDNVNRVPITAASMNTELKISDYSRDQLENKDLTGVSSSFLSCRVLFYLPGLACTDLLLLLRKHFGILRWKNGFDELLDLPRISASCDL